MKNKKGFLLGEETLKIILAVIALGFLIYFLSSLYSNNAKNQEKEEAKASLEFLMKEIRGKAEKIDVYNPENWHVLSWNEYGNTQRIKKILGIDIRVGRKNIEKPEDCKEWSNCICICNKESCEERVCKKPEKAISILIIRNDLAELTNSIKIEKPPLRMEIERAEEVTILRINGKNEP